MFKGVFYHCEGPDADIVKNKTQCLELSGNGNKWVNHKYNFDNLGQALMSLFVLSSKDGWVNIMYSGLDAVGIDQQVRFINRTKMLSDFSYHFCSATNIKINFIIIHFSPDKISTNGGLYISYHSYSWLVFSF